MSTPRVVQSIFAVIAALLLGLPQRTAGAPAGPGGMLKGPPPVGRPMPWLVLDTSLLLGGKDPPRGARWATTPEAAAEVSPGGRDARRFEDWLSIGLELREPDAASRSRVEAAAKAAGSLARLSPADRSLLALALELGGSAPGQGGATLVTDDYTMLDVASRLGLPTQTVNQQGIRASLDFRPRCTGCGRWFEAPQKADTCPVCGSAVKPRPWKLGA
jgi:UPF0271 protein